MPRKLKLTDRQCSVMRMLEEAGAEDFSTIFAAIGTGDMDGLDADLNTLYRQGLITYYRDLGQPELRYAALSREEVDSLSPLRAIHRTPASTTSGIMLTEAGRLALTT